MQSCVRGFPQDSQCLVLRAELLLGGSLRLAVRHARQVTSIPLHQLVMPQLLLINYLLQWLLPELFLQWLLLKLLLQLLLMCSLLLELFLQCLLLQLLLQLQSWSPLLYRHIQPGILASFVNVRLLLLLRRTEAAPAPFCFL